MSTGIAKMVRVMAVLLVLGGCSAASVQPTGNNQGTPIMSAADAKAMIRVEVKAL